MLKLADISVFENLQAEANHRIGVQSPMSVFNSIESCASQIAKMARNGRWERDTVVDLISEELISMLADKESGASFDTGHEMFDKEFERLRAHIAKTLSPDESLPNEDFADFDDVMRFAYSKAKRKHRASAK